LFLRRKNPKLVAFSAQKPKISRFLDSETLN
jgi:hypothetical protein